MSLYSPSFFTLPISPVSRLSFHDRRVEKSPRFNATFIIIIHLTSRIISENSFPPTNDLYQVRFRIIYFPHPLEFRNDRNELYTFCSPPLRISFYLFFFFFSPFSVSLSIARSSLSAIARHRPTDRRADPDLSETLRTGPYPPPPRYPQEDFATSSNPHRSGVREIQSVSIFFNNQ